MINKRIQAIINFAGTVSNPLLTAYTKSLRELNMNYKFRNGTLKISQSKANKAKAEALEKKLAENHATTYSEYKKARKERLKQEKETDDISEAELLNDLKAQKSFWNLQDNLNVLYQYVREGEEIPPELESVIDTPELLRDPTIRGDKQAFTDIAIKLDKAVQAYRDAERYGAMNSLYNGEFL